MFKIAPFHNHQSSLINLIFKTHKSFKIIETEYPAKADKNCITKLKYELIQQSSLIKTESFAKTAVKAVRN